MSAARQVRARDSRATSPADPDAPIDADGSRHDDPLQLLRDAIAGLKSPNGGLADQTQLANLLVEARDALERAKVVAQATTQCEGFLKDAQFDQALEALDAALLIYPSDPVLSARREETEDQQKAFHAEAAVGAALQEAQWLFDQDRPDLAAHFLKEKSAAWPDQPALISRLEELEALLPLWQQNRQAQAAMGRAAQLEQQQQWRAALTILEEALQTCLASDELMDAVQRVRDRLADDEREKKLQRRLELIRTKIAAQSWRQALSLLENTRREFSAAPQLDSLRREVDAGMRRSECEAIVAESRQCLNDGELELAEQSLRRGLDAFGPEPALEVLRKELESEREYRGELRAAQVLFGKRQLPGAEAILTRLVASRDRPDAQALLDSIRKARAAAEEEDFCERGREKAGLLIEQRQFAQAADLLANLLSLFPGNPILERDLRSAQAALDRESSKVAAVVEEADDELPEAPAPPPPPAPESLKLAPVPPPPPQLRSPAPLPPPAPPVRPVVALAPVPPPKFLVSGSARAPHAKPEASPEPRGTVHSGSTLRVRRAVIVWTASLALLCAGDVGWKLSRPVPKPPAPVAAAVPASTQPPDGQAPAAAPPESSPQLPASQPAAAENTAASHWRTEPKPSSTQPPRRFVPPEVRKTPQTQASVLPPPPSDDAIISAHSTFGLPAGVVSPVNAPAPPPAQPAPPPPTSSAPAAKPPVVQGGQIQEAQIARRVMPDYPAMARQRGVFGVVRMEGLIDEHGDVKNVKVVSGDPVLSSAAKIAVLQWKYKPATLNGRAVATTVQIEISFQDRTH